MRRSGIIRFGVAAAAWSALAMFPSVPASQAIWAALAIGGMHIGMAVELYLHCKCDDEKKAGS